MNSFRVATLNLPSQVRGRKARLYPHPIRTLAAMRLWAKHDIEVCSLQELATMSRATIRGHWRWGLVTTTNDVFPFRRIGNGVAYRKDRWQLVNRDVIHIDTPTHPKRGLRYPVVTLRNRDEPTLRVVVIAVHIPTAVAMGQALDAARGSQKVVAARNRINAQIRDVAQGYVNAGIPTVIAGDFNDGNVRDVYANWLVGAQHQVDQILGQGRGLRFTGRDAAEVGRVSDHPAMPYCTTNLIIPRV